MPDTTRVRGGQAHPAQAPKDTTVSLNGRGGAEVFLNGLSDGASGSNGSGHGADGARPDRNGYRAGTPLARLARMAFADSLDSTERILELAREHLDMDVAFVAEFCGGREVFRFVQGDGATFSLRRDDSLPLQETYCHRMVEGSIPNVISDARADRRVTDLAATARADIGTYAGVPITFSTGRVYGTLCCLSHAANPSLGERDVRFMHVLAYLLAERLERHELEWRRQSQQVQRVRRVLARGELAIVYQPIFELRSERVVGVEALARFPAKHPPTPDRWFAEADDVGLGVELEGLAIQSALGSLAELPSPLYLAINISPQTIVSSSLDRALEGAPLDRIVLEVTEHVRVDDYDRVNRALGHLRDQGIRLAIDDVGAGFASLRHILRLAPDIIKLDLALTRDIDTDPVRRAMAASLTSFADETRASITAEGIETEGELQALRKLGASHGQGFGLAAPAPLHDLALAG